MCRILSLWLLLVVFLPAGGWATEGFDREPPYDRVLVLSGYGMEDALFAGIIHGLSEAGSPPDLIIASCGASISAGLVHVQPDPEKLFEYLQSEAYFDLRSQVKLRKKYHGMRGKLALVADFLAIQARNGAGPNPNIPDIFRPGMLEVPQDLAKGSLLDAQFTPEGKGPKLAILCAKVNYTARDFGQDRRAWMRQTGKKLYSLVVYSDKQTLSSLEKSETSEAFEVALQDRMDIEALPILDPSKRVCEACRCSISDPYLMDPCEDEKGNALISGAVDHYPYEMARRLGKEVFMVAGGLFSDEEALAYQDIFTLDINQRIREMREQEIDRWIDLTDFDCVHEDGFCPKKDGTGIDFELVRSVPLQVRQSEQYGEEFKAAVKKLYEYGWERGQEAAGAESRVPESFRVKLP